MGDTLGKLQKLLFMILRELRILTIQLNPPTYQPCEIADGDTLSN